MLNKALNLQRYSDPVIFLVERKNWEKVAEMDIANRLREKLKLEPNDNSLVDMFDDLMAAYTNRIQVLSSSYNFQLFGLQK